MCSHFPSVYKNYIYYSAKCQPNSLRTTQSYFSPLHVGIVFISLPKVFESINSLKFCSNPGPDLIPSIFLTKCKYFIALPLNTGSLNEIVTDKTKIIRQDF